MVILTPIKLTRHAITPVNRMGFEEGLQGVAANAQTTFFLLEFCPQDPYNHFCFCPPSVSLQHLQRYCDHLYPAIIALSYAMEAEKFEEAGSSDHGFSTLSELCCPGCPG